MTGEEVQNVTPADVPELWELCRRDNERLGTDFIVPRIFDDQDRQMANVPLALKVVRSGRIVQGHIFERQVELLSFGADARGTALGLPALAAAERVLERMGYRGFHALVALGRVAQFDAAVAQRLNMQRDDARLAHFYKAFGGAS
ncbi:MAG TPA: hypothetical protein VFP94_09295 [Terriglobales bacterium]|nr:hypothetical protein [Terriglobales bacterium]